MDLDIQKRGETTVLVPHGRIAEAEAHRLEKELTTLLDEGEVKLVIDMSDVPYVNSSCLGALMMAMKRARQCNGHLRIVRPQPLVRDIFESTKLTKIFSIHESVEEAIDKDLG